MFLEFHLVFYISFQVFYFFQNFKILIKKLTILKIETDAKFQ
jgi:hypothetical protein